MILTPIIVDTSDLMSQYSSLTGGDINDMLDGIAKGLANAFAQKLTMNAEQELNQTRDRYIKNIVVVDSGKLEGTVILDYSKDKLIKMLEEGASSFDMKEGFLKSSKVKIGVKGNRYLTIPYRLGVPTTLGEASNFAFNLDPEAHKIAKNKPATIPVSTGSRTQGISLKELPEALQIKNVRPAVKGFPAYQHKSPVSQGVTRYQDQATGQNSYKSFRRVSENSDEGAWIHPGIQKYNLLQKTLGQFDTATEMSSLMDNELAKLGLL